MSTEALLESTEIPASAPSANPQPLDYDGLSKQLGIEIPEDATPAAPVVPETPAPDPAPAAPVPDRKAENDAQAKKRIAAKNAQSELEAAKARVAELEAWQTEHQTKYGETESRLTEASTLAEQREQKLKELSEAFRNESDPFNSGLVEEIPAIQEARTALDREYQALFPRQISNPDANEAYRRFDPSALTPSARNTVNQNIDFWEKIDGRTDVPADRKAQYQHIAVSNIAATIGVPMENFDEITVDGVVRRVLPPSHPVYKHLSHKLPDLVDASQALNARRTAALEDRAGSFKKTVSTRADNTRRFFGDTGVGVTGENLKSALLKNPDSPYLQVMSLLEPHADLLDKLKTEMEAEAALNGHFRPQLDLLETDPGERTRAANTHLARIGRRVIHAPMAVASMELAIRQASKIKSLQEELAAAKAEVERAAIQSEPGVVAGAADVTSAPDFGDYAGAAAKLGLIGKA